MNTFEPTSESFSQGYWYYRPEEQFPPPPIFHLSDSFAENKLSLAGVPGISALSDYQIRKVISGWSKILPTLEAVEMLWVAPKVGKELFEAIGKMPNLVGLCIDHSSIEKFPDGSFEKIRFLRLGSSPKFTDLEGLSKRTTLEWLETENLKRVSDFSPISKLVSLSGLAIEGSMYSTQKMETLKPLADLRTLRFLGLANTRVADQSLEPLHHLKNLERFRRADWWPKAEVQELLKVNPLLQT